MPKQLEQTPSSTLSSNEEQPQEAIFTPVTVSSVTNADILAYLRHSHKFAEIANLAQKNAVVLANCQKLGITVSDEEWQAAGDAFRQERKLWGSNETLAWLEKQRISVEEWSEGIRINLLEKKLKEYLFGATVDSVYISNRDNYKRVALSQILVVDLATSWKIVQALREGQASFCALALEHSKGKLSHENGGFIGIRYLVELVPEVAEAIANAQEGEIIGPVQSQVGYHVLKVEKWFPIELNQAVREQIMDSLFEVWLQNLKALKH